jgi:hypothetical protein
MNEIANLEHQRNIADIQHQIAILEHRLEANNGQEIDNELFNQLQDMRGDLVHNQQH